MKIPIDNAAAIGKVVRASRKAQKIRQDDAAGSIGVSENFLGKIERGSGSVQWGKLFQVLEGLGIRVMVDVPESVATYLNDSATRKNKPQRVLVTFTTPDDEALSGLTLNEATLATDWLRDEEDAAWAHLQPVK